MGSTILIIEDNEEMRENTAELLNLAGYKVYLASNGIDGLRQAKELRPDLILCDIMMPELDGYGVLRVVETTPEIAGTPFVFVTAKSEKSDFRKAMDLGADDYLTKPYDGDELLRMVDGRLKKSRLQKKIFNNTVSGFSEFLDDVMDLNGSDFMPKKKTLKKYKKKELVFSEGDSAGHLFLINSGNVRTYRTNEEGKEFTTGILKEGDFFGYISLFDDLGRRESAIAMSDAELILVLREDFLRILHSNDIISLKFIKFLANNIDDREEKLIKLAYDSARKKVAEALLFVHKKQEIDSKDFIHVGRETISSIAGIAPESVSRNISDFKDEGLITTENGNIKIVNVEKLKSLKF